MRSVNDDRTARAVIRDEAMRLFAERGPDAVSVRQIAAAAGVSAALVVHHFGSKEGLRDVVDQHVVQTFDDMIGQLSGPGAADMFDPASTGSVVEVMLRNLPADSPLPAYLGRLLVSDAEAGTALFGKLFEISRGLLASLAEAGVVTPGADPAVRAAFLLVNDLAVFLLRDRLTEALGSDPLSQEGMQRWAAEVLTIYAGGLTAQPEQPYQPEQSVRPDQPDQSAQPGQPEQGGAA